MSGRILAPVVVRFDYLFASLRRSTEVSESQQRASEPGGGDAWHSLRLQAVRGFAAYLHSLDPTHEVPAAEILPDPPQPVSEECAGEPFTAQASGA